MLGADSVIEVMTTVSLRVMVCSGGFGAAPLSNWKIGHRDDSPELRPGGRRLGHFHQGEARRPQGQRGRALVHDNGLWQRSWGRSERGRRWHHDGPPGRLGRGRLERACQQPSGAQRVAREQASHINLLLPGRRRPAGPVIPHIPAKNLKFREGRFTLKNRDRSGNFTRLSLLRPRRYLCNLRPTLKDRRLFPPGGKTPSCPPQHFAARSHGASHSLPRPHGERATVFVSLPQARRVA